MYNKIYDNNMEEYFISFKEKEEVVLDKKFITEHVGIFKMKDIFNPAALFRSFAAYSSKTGLEYKGYQNITYPKNHSLKNIKDIFKVKSCEEDDTIEIKYPWLYFRFFMLITALIVTAFLLQLDMVGIVLSVVLFPLSILLYIYEYNYPRSISLGRILKIILIGGALSIGFVLFVRIFTGYRGGLWGNIMTGIIEELAKALIALYYIRKYKPKYMLTGLLIGAAVGTGFSIIETFTYVYRPENIEDISKLLIALIRGLLSIGGGHIFWAGITAGALTMISGRRPATLNNMTDGVYVKVITVFIILHGLWNYFGSLTVSIIICIIGIAMLRNQIRTGVLQYEMSRKINCSTASESLDL